MHILLKQGSEAAVVSSGQGVSSRAEDLRRESMLKSMSLQPTEFFLRQAADTPPSLFVLSELPCSVLQGSAEAGERLLHRTPTERIDSTGLLMSYTVQYRTSLQRKSLCKVKANKGLGFTFPGRYLSCGSDHVCPS